MAVDLPEFFNRRFSLRYDDDVITVLVLNYNFILILI